MVGSYPPAAKRSGEISIVSLMIVSTHLTSTNAILCVWNSSYIYIYIYIWYDMYIYIYISYSIRTVYSYIACHWCNRSMYIHHSLWHVKCALFSVTSDGNIWLVGNHNPVSLSVDWVLKNSSTVIHEHSHLFILVHATFWLRATRNYAIVVCLYMYNSIII